MTRWGEQRRLSGPRCGGDFGLVYSDIGAINFLRKSPTCQMPLVPVVLLRAPLTLGRRRWPDAIGLTARTFAVPTLTGLATRYLDQWKRVAAMDTLDSAALGFRGPNFACEEVWVGVDV